MNLPFMKLAVSIMICYDHGIHAITFQVLFLNEVKHYIDI